MNLQYVSSPIFLTLLLPLILFMMLLKKKKAESETDKLPPGPWKLPIIGSVHHLAGGESLPHRTLRDLAKRHGPLMHLQMGEVPLVVASTAKTAKEIMKTHDLSFANRPEMPTAKYTTYGFTDVAFAPYGPYWRQMRKICMLELLTVKRVDSFTSIRKEEVLSLLSSIASSCNSQVNLTRKFYFLTNNVVARAAFGAKSQNHDMFLSTMKETVRTINGFGVVDLFPSSKLVLWITGMKAKLKKNHKKLDHVLSHILEECRLRRNLQIKKREVIYGAEEFEENLVDILLRLQQHENLEVPITDNNIKAIVMDMFTAGTETSATILGWAMSELMKNPRVMIKAQKEVRDVLGGKERVTEADIQQLPFLKLIVKETMRLHPPLPLLLPRENREKCQVMGYELPTHTKVIVNVWAIGRDPLYWGDDAETFKPERFADNSMDFKGTNFEFLPFGAGRRMCPGVTFGIASVELPLALLLYHFNWELPQGMGTPENLDMTEDFGASVGRKSELYLVPNLCIPLPPK